MWRKAAVSASFAAGALVVARAVAGSAMAQNEPLRGFISPMGEPFRAPFSQPYPAITWFNQADTNHDGKLSREEFRADAVRFFKLLDVNGDGKISDMEAMRYEHQVAPEIIAATVDTSGTQRPTDPNDSEGLRNTPLSTIRQGAAAFSFLNDPEPVRSADTDFNNKTSLDEWMAAVDRKFRTLDPDETGYLTLATLPKTPAELQKPEKPDK